MSVITHRHIYCDICNEPFEESVVGADEIKHQRGMAARAGWIVVRVEGRVLDVCGGCAEVGKENAREQLRALMQLKAERTR